MLSGVYKPLLNALIAIVALAVLSIMGSLFYSLATGKVIKAGIFGEWGIGQNVSTREIADFLASDDSLYWARPATVVGKTDVKAECEQGDIALIGGCFASGQIPPDLAILNARVVRENPFQYECTWN